MFPKPLGHYSQAVRAGDFVFLSGQIPIDPQTNEICLFDGNVFKQAELVLKNIEAILIDQKLKKESVVKVTIFLKEIASFTKINEIYAQFFGSHKPARTIMEVSSLPKGVAIEIEVFAYFR